MARCKPTVYESPYNSIEEAPWYNDAILKWVYARSYRPISTTQMQVWDGLRPFYDRLFLFSMWLTSMTALVMAIMWGKEDRRYYYFLVGCVVVLMAYDFGAIEKKMMPHDRIVPLGYWPN